VLILGHTFATNPPPRQAAPSPATFAKPSHALDRDEAFSVDVDNVAVSCQPLQRLEHAGLLGA
jgi:hypothetical protein